MRRLLFVSIALISMMATAPSAHANPLPPSFDVSPDTLSSLVGLSFVTQTSGSATATDPMGTPVSYSFTEWVYSTASGTLDFFYQFRNTGGTGAHSLTDATVSGFGGFIIDVGNLAAGLETSLSPMGITGGTDSASVTRSFAGDSVDFSFGGDPITPGQSSAVLFVATNASAYDTLGNVHAGNDAVSPSAPSDEPAVVPEPSTLAIAGLGALGMIGYGLRRRRALGA